MVKFGISIEEYSRKKILMGKYEIFHIHWPEASLAHPSFIRVFLKSTIFLILVFLCKLKGTKIVWTIHNLRSHEYYHPLFEGIFWKFFIPMVDCYISLGEKADSMAKEKFLFLKRKKGFIIPLGHYRNYYSVSLKKEEARRKLGIPLKNKVIIFLGLIRNYKNVPALINAFKQIKREDLSLLIVGKPRNEEIKQDVINASEGDSRIKLTMRFVSDEEVSLFMKASDLMVLPQKEIFNSSSAILALSFNIPVVLPEKWTGEELKSKFGNEWVKTFDKFSPEVIKESLEWINFRREEWSPPEEMEWENIAYKTIKAYHSLFYRESK